MLRSFRKLWSLLSRRERTHAVGLFLATALGAFLEMLGVGAIPVFVGLLAQPDDVLPNPTIADGLRRFGIDSQRELTVWGSAALLGLFLVKNAYIAGLMHVQGRFVFGRFVNLSSRLFDAYLHAPYTFHLRRNTAELLRNTNQETTTVALNVFVPGLVVLTETLVVVCVAGLLLFIEPLISLLALLLLGGSSLLFWMVIRRRTVQLGLVQQEERRWMIQAVNEGLGGIKDVKVLNRERHFLEMYRRSVRAYARTASFSKFVGQLPRPFIETVAVAGMLLVGFVFLAQGRPIAAIIPTLALFGIAVVRLMPSAQRLMAAVSMIRFNQPSLDVITTELAAAHRWRTQGAFEPRPPDSVASNSRLTLRDAVVLDSVSYTYPGQESPALRDITIALRHNRMVAFVGASGAGKSTLVDVLLGLVEPDHGRVLVDGVDIHASGSVAAWQRAIGYIPQSIFLADASVRRNVAFGLDDAEIDDSAVWESLDAAQLSDFVRSLPDGIATVVGERGVRISGGQRQRVGIARALYHRPTVLIMDEATSALDNRTEREFVEAVDRLRYSSTVVVVAHRLTTVSSCDHLYLLEHGRIVDEGSYDALQRTSRPFRDMASIGA